MLTSPPIAPKTLNALHKLGIFSRADLQAHGAVTVFLKLKAAGLTLTRSTLWQLTALAENRRPQDISLSEKEALLQALHRHPPVSLFPPEEEMERYMRLALDQAAKSAVSGEVPVGAVIVRNGQVLAAEHNTCIGDCSISSHAEIRALSSAGRTLQNYRLEGCDLYVTLEPCAMCASAIIQARIGRLIYGATEPKTGAAGSVLNLFGDIRLNQHTAVKSGILAEECRAVLQRFFQSKRQQK
ncbi:MAG: tRNA adenosine(34) deaminase TadA [Neisseria sp.]|uniref:tRNA adenosine(34) deaminase TadA n=1 Tax=Neisseria sp. TaxID=192066 RepID=UPI0026DD8BEE|nr:tRNA adenosine(34) deaminase TadA [Neisseria sp.]MDO4641809.1 tRNA adenosine(34) deaminase TadA [Neisseria sp.]